MLQNLEDELSLIDVAEENRKDERLSVPVSPQLRKALEILAEQDQRYLSREATWILSEYVKQAIAQGRLPKDILNEK